MNTRLLLALTLSTTLFSSINVFADSNWIEDQNGCKHANPYPKPLKNESVTWSGECVNGYGSGYGKFQWYENNKKTNSYYIGMKENGKSSGQGKVITSTRIITGAFFNGEPTGHVQITFKEPIDGVISLEGNYQAILKKANGKVIRRYSDGKKETVFVKNGKLYASNESAEINQAMTTYMTSLLSNLTANKMSGSSCVDACREIRKEETEYCKTAFSGGNPQDTSKCVKEALDDYGTCKTDCRHAKIR